MVCFLLAAAFVAAPAAATAEQEPAGAAPLERLASTLGDLTAKLGAIRGDLAAMRAGTVPGGRAVDRLCAVPTAQAETLIALTRALEEQRTGAAAERAGWRHAEAAMTGELTALRERIAAADAALIELSRDRERLVAHIVELGDRVQDARTREVADVLPETEQPMAGLITPPHALPATRSLRVTPSALAAEAVPALGTAGATPAAHTASRLDLQAELALAQLRIVELTTTLDTARLREEAMHAEIATLRDLTDSQIRRFVSR